MGGGSSADLVLTTLPDGTRVLSTVLTDQTPVRHVYRVIGRNGSPVHEFATLTEVHAFISARHERIDE